MIRIVYFGTADFAVAPLRALLDSPDRFEVVAVVSRPDKPAGRKQEIAVAPVAAMARERGIPLIQPTKLKDEAFHSALAAFTPDVLIVASYGRIIPQAVLDLPKIAPLNLHGSLLPKYRGASPIQAAILEGETVTGVSLMVMDAEVDHGPVISMTETQIAADETHASLEHKLGDAAAALLVRDLEPFCSGALKAAEQDHAGATFTGLISKENGLIDWRAEDAAHVERKTRAYSPWPGAHFVLRHAGTETRVKLIKADVATDAPTGTAPGTCFVTTDGQPAIVAARGVVVLLEVQPEGKKPMAGRAFLNGHKDFAEYAA
jgi:methionyl-tRNA formyltransferase